MKILFDFGHPADVHYFKNLIFYLKRNGNQVQVLARDKDVTFDLLEAYEIPYVDKGKGGTGFFDRIVYTLKSFQYLRRSFRDFKPDVCISHASPYLALMAVVYKTPHIMFNDTEQAFLFDQVVKYLKPAAYSPDSFRKKSRKNLNIFHSYMELAYLHPGVFEPDEVVRKEMGNRYILLRFVANKATHDIGHVHLDHEYKSELVNVLMDFAPVWISSEEPLPKDLKPYRLGIHPSKMHDVIAGATLLIGEGATMCSEAAMLGVPSVFINQNSLGYITELDEKYGLVKQFSADKKGRFDALDYAVSILKDPNQTEAYSRRRERMLQEKKNMFELMVQFLEQTAAQNGKSSERTGG